MSVTQQRPGSLQQPVELRQALALVVVFGLGPWIFLATLAVLLALDRWFLALAGPRV